MGAGEGFEAVDAARRELQTYDALVVVVVDPFDEVGSDSAVDELDDAVMAQQQVLGDVADRRRTRRVPANGKQQLVLRWGQTDALGLFLAPPLKSAQPVTEAQHPGEVVVGQRSTTTIHIVPR